MAFERAFVGALAGAATAVEVRNELYGGAEGTGGPAEGAPGSRSPPRVRPSAPTRSASSAHPLSRSPPPRGPAKRLVLLVAAVLVVFIAVSAVARSFVPFVVLRFLSGLPHDAYFGVAAVLDAALVPSERRARGLAAVKLGLTVANIVGVPAATWLGETFGWRSAYVSVAAVALGTGAGPPARPAIRAAISAGS